MFLGLGERERESNLQQLLLSFGAAVALCGTSSTSCRVINNQQLMATTQKEIEGQWSIFFLLFSVRSVALNLIAWWGNGRDLMPLLLAS